MTTRWGVFGPLALLLLTAACAEAPEPAQEPAAPVTAGPLAVAPAQLATAAADPCLLLDPPALAELGVPVLGRAIPTERPVCVWEVGTRMVTASLEGAGFAPVSDTLRGPATEMTVGAATARRQESDEACGVFVDLDASHTLVTTAGDDDAGPRCPDAERAAAVALARLPGLAAPPPAAPPPVAPPPAAPPTVTSLELTGIRPDPCSLVDGATLTAVGADAEEERASDGDAARCFWAGADA